MVSSHTGCGCMTSQTGALIIGWLEVILIIPVILAGIVGVGLGIIGLPQECPITQLNPDSVIESGLFYVHHDQCIKPEFRQYVLFGSIATLVFCGLYLIAPCCLIRGANNSRPGLLIPYIVCGVLKKICIVLGIIVVFAAQVPEAAIIPLISFVIELYKTVVVCCHYSYLGGKTAVDNIALAGNVEYAKLEY